MVFSLHGKAKEVVFQCDQRMVVVVVAATDQMYSQARIEGGQAKRYCFSPRHLYI